MQTSTDNLLLESFEFGRRASETRPVVNLDFWTDQVAAQLCDDDSFLEELSSRIVGQGILIQLSRLDRPSASPFDSVYLSALEPDVVSEETINNLLMRRKVKDVSSEIEFGDD